MAFHESPDVIESLDPRSREILDFEREWWKYAGAKEQAVKERFDLSPTRYYQLLNRIIDDEQALAYDPMLVKRLRRAPPASVSAPSVDSASTPALTSERPVAKHSPPDDNSFTASLVRHVAAAVALVAVVAAAFWGIGQVRDDGSSMTVASSPGAEDAGVSDPSPTVTATAEPPASEAPPADEGTEATADATTPTTEATTPTETETSEPEPDATAAATENEVAPSGDEDPADISVQVLDAAGDGGASAAEVADELRGDGFQVVAENRAVRQFEVTTVFYTPGNEAKARFIADMYGYREVAPEPGNLSHSVDVHLVVGSDA